MLVGIRPPVNERPHEQACKYAERNAAQNFRHTVPHHLGLFVLSQLGFVGNQFVQKDGVLLDVSAKPECVINDNERKHKGYRECDVFEAEAEAYERCQ